MNIEQQIEQDLKVAMLSGDKTKAETLRGLRAALLNVKVEQGKRESGLTNEEVISILSKEAKKRQESADLFSKGGNQAKADAESVEKKLIEKYLPRQLSESEVSKLVDDEIATTTTVGTAALGQIIGAVKTKVGANADGALIARIVKEKLSQ